LQASHRFDEKSIQKTALHPEQLFICTDKDIEFEMVVGVCAVDFWDKMMHNAFVKGGG